MPFTFGAFLIAAISIIGLPPGGGSWSKWLLALGAAETGQLYLMATLMISSLLNIAYLVPIAVKAFIVPAGEKPLPFNEGPLLCVVPLCVTAVGSVVLFFVADWIYQGLLPIVQG
jgi:multicomponent Na+:H+ antiporter subunit D